MTMNVQQPTINKNQKVRMALTGRLLTGFLLFQTLNQRVAGSNPARLTIKNTFLFRPLLFVVIVPRGTITPKIFKSFIMWNHLEGYQHRRFWSLLEYLNFNAKLCYRV